jgi:hypothetical protein
MARKISAIIVLLLFAAMLMSAPAFAAKAATQKHLSARAQEIQNMPAAKIVGGEMVQPQTESVKPSSGYSTTLGFNAAPANAIQIGTTYMDYQSNGSIGEQIVEGGGWTHSTFMKLDGPSFAGRKVSYVAVKNDFTDTTFVDDVDGVAGAGYCDIGYDATGTGAAVLGYHNVAGGFASKATRDFGFAIGSFTPFAFPNHAGADLAYPPAVCGNITSGTSEPDGGPIGSTSPVYIWPTIATDVDPVSGQGIVHVFAIESPSSTSDNEQSVVYYKSNPGISGPADDSCGMWVDSAWNISQVVAADPLTDNVALAWTKPTAGNDRSATLNAQENMDVWYMTSSDAGDTWNAPVNLTQYTGSDLERAYTDLSAIYTSDGCLHIAWNTSYWDSAQGGLQDFMVGKIRHWDDCNQCITLAIDASNVNTDQDGSRAWAHNVSRLNLSECQSGFGDLLYLTYARTLNSTAEPHLSHDNFALYDVWAQASSTGGQTWGPPVNLTNTGSANGCGASGDCDDAYWNSSARYVADSLRIWYIDDKDAGGIAQTEGNWTDNPVMNFAYACFDMDSYVSLGATPSQFTYPFHVAPSASRTEDVTLTNSGNAGATWSASVSDGWMSIVGASSGSCPAGCTNTSQFQVQFTGPATEGLYSGTIDVTYSDPARGSQAALSIPVDLYVFNNFYLPEDADIRTSQQRMNVNQASEIADGVAGKSFSYFADTTDYIFDGTLFMGTGPNDLTYSTYGGGGNISLPTASNPFGFLYAAVPSMSVDSNSFASYRYAMGKGYNRDSSLEFSVEWYAPKHPDTADVYIGSFALYKGPNNPTGTVSNLAVGYYCDWDVPSDSGNVGGVDATRQLLWQRAAPYPPDENRWGGDAAYRDDGQKAVGGFILRNPVYIYPNAGFENDTLWNWISLTGQNDYYTPPPDTVDDMSAALLIYKGASIDGSANDTLKFCVILAGQRNAATVSGIQGAIDKGIAFMCAHGILPGAAACQSCKCGDADGSGGFSIGDAVYIINYIFGGGPAPNPLCLGDADGSGGISIGDAVYLINYIFGGGPAPHCP